MEFILAPEINSRLAKIISVTGLSHLKPDSIVCFRSFGSKSKAQARIWSFPKIWQIALQISPHYSIEVISEKFDKLSEENQNKVLIHELLHIPRNFSGSLLPHRGRGRRIDQKIVNYYYSLLEKK